MLADVHFLCPKVGGRCVGLHIGSQSLGKTLGCRPQTGPGHRTGPVCLSTGETSAASLKLKVYFSLKVYSPFNWTVLCFQFPELHAMIMRRFSSKGDVDRAWQYVLQVRHSNIYPPQTFKMRAFFSKFIQFKFKPRDILSLNLSNSSL